MGSSGSKSSLSEPSICLEDCSIRSVEITERVLSGDLPRLNAISFGGKFSMRDADITDELKPLKAIATDMVVAEFFATAGPLYRFLQLVHSVFSQALNVYRNKRGLTELELFFIFKGGNILRIIAHQFLAELPQNAKQEIEGFYSQFFKRSDNDFGIYLDPEVVEYDDRFDELSTLSYYLQVDIRKVILSDAATYFDYSRYNDAHKKKVLEAWLSKFGMVNGETYTAIKLIPSGPDSTTMFTKEDFGASAREICKAHLEDYGTVMRVTHNNALEFAGNEGVRRKFNLTRTKLHFQLEGKKGPQAVEGELIDVSIGHRDDTGTQHFFDHPEGQIVSYTLKHPDTEVSLTFKSYSLQYVTSDLEGILFLSFETPWEDPKYVKRLNRLMYVYFIDVFVKRGNNNGRLGALLDFKSYIINPIWDGASMHASVFKSRHGDLNMVKMVDYMQDLASKTSSNEEDGRQYLEMSETMLKNIDFLTRTLKRVKDYCLTDGFAQEKDMYVGNLKQFV